MLKVTLDGRTFITTVFQMEEARQRELLYIPTRRHPRTYLQQTEADVTRSGLRRVFLDQRQVANNQDKNDN